MNRTAFDTIALFGAAAAALAFAACAGARPSASPAQAKPVQTAATPAAAVVAAPPDETSPAAMPTGTLTRVGGVVVSVDAASRTLTIKDYSGLTRAFRIAGEAPVTRGGDEAAVGLDGIAVGDRVRLKVGGDVTASVHVLVNPAQ
jgi:hypothetical protein